jgi:hypothetical protein
MHRKVAMLSENKDVVVNALTEGESLASDPAAASKREAACRQPCKHTTAWLSENVDVSYTCIEHP